MQEALIAAAADPEQRSTAILAMRGRHVLAATWPTDPATLRTLTSSDGVTALAIFSDASQLHDAAVRYGWLGLDGKVPSKSLHMSEAVRFAKQHRAQLLVVDIAASHSLELDEGEMELVGAGPSSRPLSYSGMPPVRTSSRPVEDASPSESVLVPDGIGAPKLPKEAEVGPAEAGGEDDADSVSAAFGASNTATLLGLSEAPADAFFDALSAVLREYPEVEWASVVRATRGPGDAAPSIALRIEPTFRKNLAEITAKLREASAAAGLNCDVLLLDTPEQMKNARQTGRPFYPWRKKD